VHLKLFYEILIVFFIIIYCRNSSINDQAQCFPLPRQSLPGGATLSTGTSSRAPFIQGKVLEGRSSNLSITPSVTITPTTGPVMNLKTKNVSFGLLKTIEKKKLLFHFISSRIFSNHQ
jgi:hypothetical protein